MSSPFRLRHRTDRSQEIHAPLRRSRHLHTTCRDYKQNTGISVALTVCQSPNMGNEVDRFGIVVTALFNSKLTELPVAVSSYSSSQLGRSTKQSCVGAVKRLSISVTVAFTDPTTREDGNEKTITFHRLSSSTSAS